MIIYFNKPFLVITHFERYLAQIERIHTIFISTEELNSIVIVFSNCSSPRESNSLM